MLSGRMTTQRYGSVGIQCGRSAAARSVNALSLGSISARPFSTTLQVVPPLSASTSKTTALL